MASNGFETIVSDFAFLEEWEDRYKYIIELGRQMPAFDAAMKTRNFKVDGCASQVWLVPTIAGSGPDAIFSFSGDSDALIVRGLIAVLHALFDGLTARAISQVDALAELGRLGLDQHLSSQRSNGLRAMIVRINSIVSGLLAAKESDDEQSTE